jgi:N utilization substance protein A
VDIVPFSDEPREFVMRALQPAKVKEVHLDDLSGTATVVVHDFQLSLAIGKEGQNARLAARLTGWRIDIKSETQIAEEEAYANQEWAEGEWVENEAGEMVWQPAEGGEAVSAEEWSLGGASDDSEEAGAGPQGDGRSSRSADSQGGGAGSAPGDAPPDVSGVETVPAADPGPEAGEAAGDVRAGGEGER